MTQELPAPDRLTAREHQVLLLLATDLDNRSIAERLGVSRHTLRHHITSVYAKLGCPDRARAIVRGLHVGLIDPHQTNAVGSVHNLHVDSKCGRVAQGDNVVMLWVGDSSSRAWHAVSPQHFEIGRAHCGLVPDRRNGDPAIWGGTCRVCHDAIRQAPTLTPKVALLSQHWHVSAGHNAHRCVSPAAEQSRSSAA